MRKVLTVLTILFFISFFSLIGIVRTSLAGTQTKSCSCSASRGCACNIVFSNFITPGYSLTSASVDIDARGDLNGSSEYITISVDGYNQGNCCTGDCNQCSPNYANCAVYNVTSYASDNSLTIECDSSYGVNICSPHLDCRATLSWAELPNVSPPSVSTDNASGISDSQATLNGNLTDLGGAGSCNVWFEWGADTSYGNETTHNIQSSTGGFSAAISGLSPDTTYHFRAVAENPGGIVYGDDQTFKTKDLIFYERFPNSDSKWNGSSDTEQDEPGWKVYQDRGDSDSIRVRDYDVNRGTSPPSGGNQLIFNDCDYGFRDPETYAIAYVPIDLSGYQNVSIEYYWQSDDVDSGEGLKVAYSTDSTNGKDGTWYEIASHINPTDDNWYRNVFDLPDSACVSDFKLRFSSKSNRTNENVFVDDVKLVGRVALTENCQDGIDNDGDGFIDCNDADCAGDNWCNVGDCTQGETFSIKDWTGDDVYADYGIPVYLNDGNIIVAVNYHDISDPHSNYYGYIIKISPRGRVLKSVRLGGLDFAESVTATNDGGFLVDTHTGWLIKFNSSLEREWKRLIGLNETFTRSLGLRVAKSTGNNFYIFNYASLMGQSGGSAGVSKLNANGNVLFEKPFGVDRDGIMGNVTNDGGFVLVYPDFGTGDFVISKYNSGGSFQFAKSVKVSGYNLFPGFYDIINTSDGGYLVTDSLNENWVDTFTVKLNSSGDLEWARAYNTPTPINKVLRAKIIEENDGYIFYDDFQQVAESSDFEPPAYIWKTNKQGEVLWAKEVRNTDWLSVGRISGGGYALCGLYCTGGCDFSNWRSNSELMCAKTNQYFEIKNCSGFISSSNVSSTNVTTQTSISTRARLSEGNWWFVQDKDMSAGYPPEDFHPIEPICRSNCNPILDSVNYMPDPAESSQLVKFDSVANDPDGDKVKFYLCKSVGASLSAGCSGEEWCSSEFVNQNPSCSFAAPNNAGDFPYYAYVFDEFGASATPISGSFQVQSSSGACQPHNVWGWAWAGAPQASGGEKLGLGWISFSCKNQGTGPDYGVDIQSDGNLTGYAYFDMDDPNTGEQEVGWIDFNPSLAGRPGPPNKTATVDLDGSVCGTVGCVYGWARAVNHDSSWDGWIKLRKDASDSGADYGVSIDPSTGHFSGWAWGGDVVGWVSFNCLNRNTACGTTNNYHVQTSFSFIQPPTATDFRKDSETYCLSTQKKGHIDLSWLYTSDGGYPQEEYKIAISTNPGFGGATEVTKTQPVSPGSRGTSGLDVVPSPDLSNLEIGYNDNYWIRVKTKDNQDNWSDWSNTIQITTPLHAYPWPDFSLTPESPAVDEVASTTNSSTCFNNSNNETSCSSWLWTIPSSASFVDGGPNSFEPSLKFSNPGDNDVTLKAVDPIGSCSKTKTIGIRLPLPEWTETGPGQ